MLKKLLRISAVLVCHCLMISSFTAMYAIGSDWNDLVEKTGLMSTYAGFDKSEKKACRELALKEWYDESGYVSTMCYGRQNTASTQRDMDSSKEATDKVIAFCRCVGITPPRYSMVNGFCNNGCGNAMKGRLYNFEDYGDWQDLTQIWGGYTTGLTLTDLSANQQRIAKNPEVIASMVRKVAKAVRKISFE
jgi:hypothetical protein